MIDIPIEPKIMSYLFAKASARKVPLSAAFELSPECNMNCKMCYVRMNKAEMDKVGEKLTVNQWLQLAKEAREMGLLYILITGGEPFLQEDFKKLYLELKKMGFIISINSNGTLIDEEVVQWLAKDPPNRINITLYGASDETYKRLCNNPNGFTQTTKAIKLLKDAGISVKLNGSMTPDNIDDLEKMYKIAESLDVKINVATYMFPPLRRDKDSIGKNNRFDEESVGKYTAKNDLYKYGLERFKYRAEQIKAGNFLLDDEAEKNDILEGSCMRCRAGKSTTWISWDGKMTSCGIMDKPVSYPLQVGFKQAWNTIVEETEKLRLPVKCSSCKKRSICNVCAAVAYTETGQVSGVPHYMCAMTESVIKETEKLYNELELDKIEEKI